AHRRRRSRCAAPAARVQHGAQPERDSSASGPRADQIRRQGGRTPRARPADQTRRRFAASRRRRKSARWKLTRCSNHPRIARNMAEKTIIAVVGLGYVGLPLAVEFGKRYPTIGFDLSAAKIDAYRKFNDPTGEVSESELRAAQQLAVTNDATALR